MIKKGTDFSMLAASLGAFAVGLGLVGLGTFTNFGFRISIVPFTGWVLSAVGGLVLVAGVAMAALSMTQKKCVGCNKSLETGICAFEPRAETDLLSAIDNNRFEVLGSLPMGRHDGPNVQVSLDFCDHCKGVGLLSVSRFTPQRTAIVTDRLLQGPTVGALVAVVMHRQAAHEERYENA